MKKYDYVGTSGHVSEETAYKLLANAIIEQACTDYRKLRSKSDTRIWHKEIEDFLRSEWFATLSRGCVSGETVIKHLRGVDD